jgi:putative glutamine amidotransferase
MSRRPYRALVAVVAYHLGDDRVARWPRGGYGVPAPYLEALRRAGARTAIVAPGEEGDPGELLEPFDGLLLVGGGDVDPARWGGPSDGAHTYGVEPDRDAMEIAVLHEALRLGLPTLCICRGMQVLNVAFGGTLHPHLPDLDGMLEHGVPVLDTQSLHDVAVEPRSRLFATTKSSSLVASSHHHQGVDRVGDGLVATGRTSDGLVEGIELDRPLHDSEPWMVGVQWHPEDTAETDAAQQSLFDALALLARLRGSRARDGQPAGRSRDYQLEEPDPAWPGAFEEESQRIRQALDGAALRIDHVGSTSVPGLAAKPIVDIQVSLAALEPRDGYVPALEQLGYRHALDPIRPDHEYFSRDVDGERRFQIHVCVAGSGWEIRHLAFRDWLREHPEDAASYAELKRRLVGEHPRDIMSYVDGKTGFITDVEARAMAGRETSVA